MKIHVVEQWNAYLKTVGIIDERQLEPIQAQEMKRAFMAGFGQALAVMKKKVGPMHDGREELKVVDDMLFQIQQFWLTQNNNFTKQ